ncbi:MAG TPA: transglutaminase domain-containing protein [Papillibacter sp.]|jgi:hypothetical protein|nr:transglutaminase domain-containing protein [Papillibacter sp.]
MGPDGLNFLSVIFLLLFTAPVLTGLLLPLTESRMLSSISRLIHGAVFLAAAGLSALFTASLFSDRETPLKSAVVAGIPVLGEAIERQDFLAWIFVFVTVLLIGQSILRLAAAPLVGFVLWPLVRRLMGSWFFSKNYVRRAMSALWQVPRALGMVLLTALVCTSYIALSGNEAFEVYAGRSPLFRVIEEKAIAPLVQTETVQKIPETIDDVALRLARSLSEEGRRRFITVFINGETVGNAVRASPAINNTAIDIVRGSVDRLERARRIYNWICANITYDDEKLVALDEDPFQLNSGAVAAFSERSGICFDIASLYAAMCRAVHVPVRLITGEAVGAGGWVSHAWNEVYDAENHRWVPVDATFGLAGKNYFDSDTFHLDHRNPEIQGQWPEDMP